MKSAVPPTVAAYYFPNYHIDPRNETVHGPGWTEWDLVRRASPRFPGHRQPLVPAWGYEDEADPRVMEKKIAAAVGHGVDCFIFDWYYYNDGTFLERCLNEGFLGAANVGDISFCLMWANHDWINIHPAKKSVPSPLLYPGRIDWPSFRNLVDHVVGDYFSHPSYFKIDGAPVFSIYLMQFLIDSFGSIFEARRALDYFREKTIAAGHPDLHLNVIVWKNCILETGSAPVDLPRVIEQLGFQSATSYVWIHYFEMNRPVAASYEEAAAAYFSSYDKTASQLSVPLWPNVTMGWDATPRTEQSELWKPGAYPYHHILEGNTPEQFARAMRQALERATRLAGPSLVTVNAWNEWTEGSYLEPDSLHGLGYLEALRQVKAA